VNRKKQLTSGSKLGEIIRSGSRLNAFPWSYAVSFGVSFGASRTEKQSKSGLGKYSWPKSRRT
jgi:hypothetical protein